MQNINRFINSNNPSLKEINLSEKEIEIFDKFEYGILYDNGLKWANGGYSFIEIKEVIKNEDGNNFLECLCGCGIQDEDGNSHDSWTMYFDRKNLKFVDEIDY